MVPKLRTKNSEQDETGSNWTMAKSPLISEITPLGSKTPSTRQRHSSSENPLRPNFDEELTMMSYSEPVSQIASVLGANFCRIQTGKGRFAS